MNSYLSKNFYKDIKIVDVQRFEGETKLAWQYRRTNYVKNIVIHHTYTDYKSSAEGIKNIHKFHALSRQWGDIGYHYIIGYDGEVYEGRAGGDYVIASHDTWNNRSTVGISIMGNYDIDILKESQYNSLKKLVSHLTKTYGIDLNKKIPYHKECFGTSCKNGLETNYYFPIVGHKDGKATSCPGHYNYTKTIPMLLKELQPETAGYKKISYTEITAQKNKYKKYLNNRDWSKIKTTINNFSQEKQKSLKLRLKYLSNREIGWKNKMLVKKALEEIN